MSDFSKLSKQDLEDIAYAANIACRNINIMSHSASRFISIEERAYAELKRREQKT